MPYTINPHVPLRGYVVVALVICAWLLAVL